LLLGANTPWKRVRLTRGFGIRPGDLDALAGADEAAALEELELVRLNG
jgi:hypothetical protein